MTDALGGGAMWTFCWRRLFHMAWRSAPTVAMAVIACPLALTAQSRADTGANRASESRAMSLLGVHRAMATRPELESLAASLEQRAFAEPGKPDNWARERAQLIRARLSRGDFRPGDRLYVTVTLLEAGAIFGDTVTVGPGDSLSLRGITAVAVSGLLRSEVQPAVEKAVERLYKNATVRAEPLVRVAVLEGVGRPGFYDVSSNLVLSDLVMRAGGPAANAALDKIKVRRRGVELYSPASTRIALQQQLTLDQLDIQTGDEMVVPLKRSTSVVGTMQLVASLASISLLLYGIVR